MSNISEFLVIVACDLKNCSFANEYVEDVKHGEGNGSQWVHKNMVQLCDKLKLRQHSQQYYNIKDTTMSKINLLDNWGQHIEIQNAAFSYPLLHLHLYIPLIYQIPSIVFGPHSTSSKCSSFSTNMLRIGFFSGKLTSKRAMSVNVILFLS
jgi:hypothetical protein